MDTKTAGQAADARHAVQKRTRAHQSVRLQESLRGTLLGGGRVRDR